MTDQAPQKDPVQRIGKGMWIAAWALGLLLLTQFFSGVIERRENPNYSPTSYRVQGATEVVLKMNRSGQYLASGFINNYPVTFMVDTGASTVAIPRELAESIGLEKGEEFQTLTANGVGRAYATHIHRVTIGDIELRNLEGGIAESMPGGHVLLGMNALRQIEFSQKGGQLILRQGD